MKTKACYYEMHDGDSYGTALNFLFDIAAELYHRGRAIPPKWEYRPPACDDPREDDSLGADFIKDIDTKELRDFGCVLNRYIRFLEHCGEGY